MCGIAGIVGKNAATKSNTVTRMLDALAHRGPDGDGLHTAPSENCVLGHRRLAIIDLSNNAAQPMSTEEGRYTLSYNGECYNYQELKKDIPHLESSGDTAVVLHLLASQKERALENLNGMFALALWDEKEESLLLARDRFGQKPLYYYESEGTLYFASEIRAFIKAGIVDKTINVNALQSYLSFGSVQGPETILEGVRLLPQASFLKWSDKEGSRLHTYWTPPSRKSDLSARAIRQLFDSAIQRHTISDAPIGLFLSGGIDSSAILGAASRMTSNENIRALTVSFPSMPASDELDFATAMVRQTPNVQHEVVAFSGDDCINAVQSFAQIQDQPSIDGLNTWIVSQAAQKTGLKAVLSGLGSDELFGGYETFHSIPKWITLRKRIGIFNQLVVAFAKQRPLFARFEGKLIDLLNSSGSPLDVYMVRRQLFSNRQQNALLATEFRNQKIHSLDLESLHALGHGKALPDQIGLWEMYHYMSQTLLRDADIMGMKHHLEIRMPFLDAQFAEGILSLPSHARTPQTITKHKLVEAISDYLPSEHLKQRKRGFCVPLESWLPHELREFSEAGLQYLQNRNDLFDVQQITALWSSFLKAPTKIGAYRPWSLILLGHYLDSL